MPTGLGKKKSWKKRIPALDKTKIKLFLPFIRSIQLQERKQMSQELLEERQQGEKLQEEERKEVEEYKKRLSVPEQRIIQLKAEKHKLFLQLKKILDAEEEKAKEAASKNDHLGNNNISANFTQQQAAVTGSLPMMFPHPVLPGVLPPPMMFAVGMPPMFPPHHQPFPMHIGGFPSSSTSSSIYNNYSSNNINNNLNDAATINDASGRISVIGPSLTLTGGGGSIRNNNNVNTMPSDFLMMNSAMWTQQQQNPLMIPTPQTINNAAVNMSMASVSLPQLMQNSQQQSFGSFGSSSLSTAQSSPNGTFTKKKPFYGSVNGELIGNLNTVKNPQQFSQEFVELNGVGQVSYPKASFRHNNQQYTNYDNNNLSSPSFRTKGGDLIVGLSAPGTHENTKQQQHQPRTLFSGNNINNTGSQQYQRYQQQQQQRQQQTFGSSSTGNNFSSGANSQYRHYSTSTTNSAGSYHHLPPSRHSGGYINKNNIMNNGSTITEGAYYHNSSSNNPPSSISTTTTTSNSATPSEGANA